MTDLEIEDAIREAWTILYAEPAALPAARRLAAALLAVTRGTQAHPHWITPDDLWRDRLTVLGGPEGPSARNWTVAYCTQCRGSPSMAKGPRV